MYPELEQLIVVSSLTKADIAEKIGMTYNTFLLKLKGKYPFTLDEAFLLKEVLKTDLSFEKLFKFVA